MKLIEHVMAATTEYIENMPKSLRKSYGQFFTSAETASFMADMLSAPAGKCELSVLDPGAGSGILSAALIERLEKSSVESIFLVCYENDPNILDLLQSNLKYIAENSAVKIHYEIRSENYILANYDDYNRTFLASPTPMQYDMIISNPPYKKLPKDAPEALAMPDICYGAPNLYFLFAEMALFHLKDNCEMTFIIPRSWTSGAYFKYFRQRFFSECVLRRIHLFVSRDKVFDNESVLQETMIITVRKTQTKPDSITITTSNSNSDFSAITSFKAPYDVVLSGDDCYVYLVTNEDEVEILEGLNHWHDTLPSLGLKMKTGLTVDFRCRDSLRNSPESTSELATVPLFYSQHIQSGKVVFPIGKENEYILTGQPGLLQKNTNYLFVKRFTAKEEHRRLQCGVYLARKYADYTYISTQNKINFIDGLKELSECVVYGLYVLLNSTAYDIYYRVLNGSTQVNSTEVNSMPMPPMNLIEEMGRKLITARDMSEAACDRILRSYL